LASSKKILFVHTTEQYVGHLKSREKREYYYEFLIKISEFINSHFTCKFMILNLDHDNHHKDTEFIKNIELNYKLKMYDLCEDFRSNNNVYRNLVTDTIKQMQVRLNDI